MNTLWYRTVSSSANKNTRISSEKKRIPLVIVYSLSCLSCLSCLSYTTVCSFCVRLVCFVSMPPPTPTSTTTIQSQPHPSTVPIAHPVSPDTPTSLPIALPIDTPSPPLFPTTSTSLAPSYPLAPSTSAMCRHCGQWFTRHESDYGTARYFRCSQCVGSSRAVVQMVMGSCTIC